VAGLFFKRDEYEYVADPVAASLYKGTPDILGFNPSDDINGDDSNLDVYVEALVPLLADVPGVDRLEAVLGYRRSNYESIGGVDSYKGELLYRPVEPVTLRGSYQHAVRAPSVFELYLPQLPAEFFVGDDISDPCTAGSPQRETDPAAVEALCLAQGVPASLLANYSDLDGVIEGFTGGNPNLNAERASTVTVGIVLTSTSSHPLLAHAQVSLDWYRIEIDDRIAEVFAGTAVDLCFDPGANPGYSPDNRWCHTFRRDSTTGEIKDALDVNQNTQETRTSGVDLQIDWQVDAGPGQVGFNWLVSWLDSYYEQAAAGVPGESIEGTVGGKFFEGSLPEWKWSMNLGYTVGRLGLNARWNHIDGMDDYYERSFRVPAYDYLDLNASYDFDDGWLHGLSLRIGVENIADKDPPILANPVQANTDPAQYDVMGRRYYIGAKYAF